MALNESIVSTNNDKEEHIKLLFSANLSFLFNDIESYMERYEAAQKAGFTGVECSKEIYDCPLVELVEVLEKTKLQQVQMNSFSGQSNGLAALPNRSNEFQHCLELSIQYCKALNCKRLHILAGQINENDSNTLEEYVQTFITNLQYASERLRIEKGTSQDVDVKNQEGITVLIEPITTIPHYFLTRTDQAIDILKKVNCDNVKLQLDLYHHQKVHGNIMNTIIDNFHFIGHIQISQVPHRDEPSDHNGEINYKYIFSQLLKLKYKGWLGCEYTPKDTVSPFAWMYPYLAI